MAVRRFWSRAMYGSGVDIEQLQLAAPPSINQTLEPGQSYTCELIVAGNTTQFVKGMPVKVSRRDLRNSDEIVEFSGTVDLISGAVYPHAVKLICVGPLSKLRFAPETDINMSTRTDIEAVRFVLTTCGITFDDDDIDGWGASWGDLGEGATNDEQRVYWRAGQTGADFISELDTVLNCATLEVGDGRVVRFYFERHPDASQITAGTNDRYYVKGTSGYAIYDIERERGRLTDVRNRWKVTGWSIHGEEDTADEGCSYTPFSVGVCENSELGTGVLYSETYSSDLIRTEAQAKTVALIRLREFGNSPDSLRIETPNDPQINPGKVVGVKAPTYGIDLTGDYTATPYLITDVRRDGDIMLLSLVGGPDTCVDFASVGGIEKKCNDDETDTGTDPDSLNPPGAGRPPDLPILECDPITDPTCIPDDLFAPDPGEINTNDQFINCEVIEDTASQGPNDGGDTAFCTGLSGWVPRCYGCAG